MATSLPVTIDADYPDDGSPSRKTHQQHHDALHGYTNSHDTAADPHGDRAAASAALTAHTAAADPHTVYVKKVGGDTITASGAAVVPLVVKGASGQTGNLLEARNNSGVLLVTIGGGGSGTISTIGDLIAGAAGSTQLGGGGFFGATLNVTARTTDNRGLIIRGLPGQTGPLAEFQNSSGTVLGQITSNGSVVSTPGFFASGTIQNVSPNDPGTFLNSTAPGSRPLVVRGAASQSASLAEFQNSSGTVLSSVNKDGWLVIPLLTIGPLGNDGSVQALISASASSNRPLVVRGAAGQTANLAEFQNSSGTVLAGFGADGTLLFGGVNAGSASAGGASALPANPVGYMTVTIQGTSRKIPYYAV